MIPIRVQEATLAEVESLSVLGPFGCGFEEPLFYLDSFWLPVAGQPGACEMDTE